MRGGGSGGSARKGQGEEKQERERGVRRREREEGGEARQGKSRKVERHQGTHFSIFGDILFLPEGRLFLGGLQLIGELVTGVCKGRDVYAQVPVVVPKALNLRKKPTDNTTVSNLIRWPCT